MATLKDVMKDMDYELPIDAQFEEFEAKVRSDERTKGIDDSSLRMSFEKVRMQGPGLGLLCCPCHESLPQHLWTNQLQLVAKAVTREKERAKGEEKKARRAEKAFLEYLVYDTKPLIKSTETWDEVRWMNAY